MSFLTFPLSFQTHKRSRETVLLRSVGELAPRHPSSVLLKQTLTYSLYSLGHFLSMNDDSKLLILICTAPPLPSSHPSGLQVSTKNSTCPVTHRIGNIELRMHLSGFKFGRGFAAAVKPWPSSSSSRCLSFFIGNMEVPRRPISLVCWEA